MRKQNGRNKEVENERLKEEGKEASKKHVMIPYCLVKGMSVHPRAPTLQCK
jgi:hypothetical protein